MLLHPRRITRSLVSVHAPLFSTSASRPLPFLTPECLTMTFTPFPSFVLLQHIPTLCALRLTCNTPCSVATISPVNILEMRSYRGY